MNHFSERKSVKQSEIITYQPKMFDTVDTKSVITEHPKTSHKLSKTIGKDEKVGSNTTLYRDTQKVKFFKRKNWEHAFKGF